MQALSNEENTAGRKGDATGQFGYGAVIEEGAQGNEPHEPSKQEDTKGGATQNWIKITLGIMALGLVACGISLLAIHRWHREEELSPVQQFEEYKVKFSKSYSQDELVEKFANFVENLQEIKRLNKLTGNTKFGLTKFSDMDASEFQTKVLGFKPFRQQTRESSFKASTGALKTSTTALNWNTEGKLTPVRDQGYCGSCWAFASVATMESRYIMDTGMSASDAEDFGLSVQQMVSCDNTNWGCNGGDPPDAFEFVQGNGGLSHEDNYPYSDETWSGSTGSCTDNVEVLDGTDIDSFTYATEPCFSTNCNSMDEETLAANLEAQGPLTVCVNANYWQNYESGVMTADACGRSGYWALNHCVQLTGFDLAEDNATGKKYWIIRNSWSADGWGEDGFMRIEYGSNACGIADEALYVTLK